MTIARRPAFPLFAGVVLILIVFVVFTAANNRNTPVKHAIGCTAEHPAHTACVFKTLVGMESFDTSKVVYGSALPRRPSKVVSHGC